jgi:hypothetical protein
MTTKLTIFLRLIIASNKIQLREKEDMALKGILLVKPMAENLLVTRAEPPNGHQWAARL